MQATGPPVPSCELSHLGWAYALGQLASRVKGTAGGSAPLEPTNILLAQLAFSGSVCSMDRMVLRSHYLQFFYIMILMEGYGDGQMNTEEV
jgi:hypothetical protein